MVLANPIYSPCGAWRPLLDLLLDMLLDLILDVLLDVLLDLALSIHLVERGGHCCCLVRAAGLP